MVDTVRGVLRVRKWPRKRGTPKSALQRWWNDWFRQANLLAKYADPMSQARAIELTKGSGLYPRDVLLKAMRGTLYTWRDDTGWTWYSMAAIGDISESLDVLAQTIGSVLVRATDRWRAPPPGNINDVLTYKGAALPPIWAPASAPSSGSYENLVGTPLVVDDTQSVYTFDVDGFADLTLVCNSIVFATAAYVAVTFSTDGGATYHTAANEYYLTYLTPTAMAGQFLTNWPLAYATNLGPHQVLAEMRGFRAGRASVFASASISSGTVVHRNGFVNFDGPVTNIKIESSTGSNFKTGVLHLTGLNVGT